MTDTSKEDLVLNGRRTPLWDKRGSSGHRRGPVHSTASFPHQVSPQRSISLDSSSVPSSTLSHSSSQHADVSSSGGDHEPLSADAYSGIYSGTYSSGTMQKSVTFTGGGGGGRKQYTPPPPPTAPPPQQTSTSSSYNGGTATGNGMVNGGGTMVNGEISDSDQSAGSLPKPPHESQWYTRPVHLEKKTPSGLPTTNTVENGRSSSSRSSSKHHHHHHHHRSRKSNTPVSPDSSSSSMDNLAREFFPVTLGAAYLLNSVPPPTSPPPKPLPQANTTPWKQQQQQLQQQQQQQQPKSPGGRKSRTSRPGSAQSSSSSASKSSLDKMYLFSTEAPQTGSAAAAVLLSSPYQCELARLRMERLRIEEDHLLEVKRQEELERIRGPKAKWYELKSPRFHYEAKKNNELLKNKPQWQELMDYRSDLERASKQFQKSYTQPGLSSTS